MMVLMIIEVQHKSLHIFLMRKKIKKFGVCQVKCLFSSHFVYEGKFEFSLQP